MAGDDTAISLFPIPRMFGLRGLGRLENAASASFVEEEDMPSPARGRKGLAREVVGETDPFEVPELREWMRTLWLDEGENEIG